MVHRSKGERYRSCRAQIEGGLRVRAPDVILVPLRLGRVAQGYFSSFGSFDYTSRKIEQDSYDFNTINRAA